MPTRLRLYEHETLRDSFDFISEALVAAGGSFYVLPGRGHSLVARLTAKKVAKGYAIESVYVDGKNILRSPDGEEVADDEKLMHDKYDFGDLEEMLSHELIVPRSLMKLTYSPPEAPTQRLLYPLGYTVRKK